MKDFWHQRRMKVTTIVDSHSKRERKGERSIFSTESCTNITAQKRRRYQHQRKKPWKKRNFQTGLFMERLLTDEKNALTSANSLLFLKRFATSSRVPQIFEGWIFIYIVDLTTYVAYFESDLQTKATDRVWTTCVQAVNSMSTTIARYWASQAGCTKRCIEEIHCHGLVLLNRCGLETGRKVRWCCSHGTSECV